MLTNSGSGFCSVFAAAFVGASAAGFLYFFTHLKNGPPKPRNAGTTTTATNNPTETTRIDEMNTYFTTKATGEAQSGRTATSVESVPSMIAGNVCIIATLK